MDSFKKAIKLINKLHSEEEMDLFLKKDIIIMLHHSIEVLVKFCLVEKYGELMIHEDFDKSCDRYNRNLSKSDSKTISFMDAVNRLYALEKREIDLCLLNSYYYLNEYRNNITHYTIDLTDKELTHLLSKLVPELFDLFKKYISIFNDFVEENDLKVGFIQYDEILFWKEISSLLENYFIAIEQLKIIEEDKSKISNVFRKRKKLKQNNYISYDICPICGHETFFSEGSIIESGDAGYKWGKCELCAFELEKLQAHMVTLSSSFSYSDSLIDLLVNLISVEYTEYFLEISEWLNEDELRNFTGFYENNKKKFIENNIDYIDTIVLEAIEENEYPVILQGDKRAIIQKLDDYEFKEVAKELERLYRLLGNDIKDLIRTKYKFKSFGGKNVEYKFEFERLDFIN